MKLVLVSTILCCLISHIFNAPTNTNLEDKTSEEEKEPGRSAGNKNPTASIPIKAPSGEAKV